MKINSYKQISTKKGDKGTSRDFSNKEFFKSDLLFEVLGSIDELSSNLGVTYHYSEFKKPLKDIQRKLQDINSLIATSDNDRRVKLNQITEEDVIKLEEFEEVLLKDTIIEPVFILPGSDGSLESAYLDVSRSITRRVERLLVKFVNREMREDLELSMKYMNRLSDLLFIMARNKK